MFRKIAKYTPSFPAITGHFDLLLPKRLSSQYTCQASVKSFAPEKCKECERHFLLPIFGYWMPPFTIVPL